MKATIDRDGCIGCGMCVDICPDVFRMDDENKAEVYADVTENNLADAVDAAESCPVSVIEIES